VVSPLRRRARAPAPKHGSECRCLGALPGGGGSRCGGRGGAGCVALLRSLQSCSSPRKEGERFWVAKVFWSTLTAADFSFENAWMFAVCRSWALPGGRVQVTAGGSDCSPRSPFCLQARVPSPRVRWSPLPRLLPPPVYAPCSAACCSPPLDAPSFHVVPFSSCVSILFSHGVFRLGFHQPSPVFYTLSSLLAVSRVPPDWSSSWSHSESFVPLMAL